MIFENTWMEGSELRNECAFCNVVFFADSVIVYIISYLIVEESCSVYFMIEKQFPFAM